MREVRSRELERLATRAADAGQHAVAALLLGVCCAMGMGLDVDLALRVDEFFDEYDGFRRSPGLRAAPSRN